MTYIYSLRDPQSLEVRYIGATNDMEKRMKGHIYKLDGSDKSQWVQNLLDDGLKPEMVLLEVCPEAEADDRERYWISYYRGCGCRLLNATEGGRRGYHMSEQTRQRLSQALSKAVYRVTFPDGREATVNNLNRFSRMNQLNYGAMYEVVRGNRNHHKGFKAKKVA